MTVAGDQHQDVKIIKITIKIRQHNHTTVAGDQHLDVIIIITIININHHHNTTVAGDQYLDGHCWIKVAVME